MAAEIPIRAIVPLGSEQHALRFGLPVFRSFPILQDVERIVRKFRPEALAVGAYSPNDPFFAALIGESPPGCAVYWIDEGASTIVKPLEQLVSSQPSAAARTKMATYTLLTGIQLSWPAQFKYFSIMHSVLEGRVQGEVIPNRFSHLRSKMREGGRSLCVCFLGQYFTTSKSLEAYCRLLKEVAPRFRDPIIYFPHRHESEAGARQAAQNLGATFKRLDVPFEWWLAKSNTARPTVIASLWSTGLITSKLLLDQEADVWAIRPSSEDYAELVAGRNLDSLYQDFQTTHRIQVMKVGTP